MCGIRKKSGHFESIIGKCRLSLYFCKKLFSVFESVTSKSHDNNLNVV